MRTRLGLRHPSDEQGAIAVLTAFLMVGLMISAAIVIDLGNARAVRRQSQNASDAASLAGANVLYPATALCPSGGAKPCFTEAVAAAKSYTEKNLEVSPSVWTTCAAPIGKALPYVPSGETSCISFDSATRPTLVRVYVPTRTVATFFGGFTGNSSIPVGSSAQALITPEVKCTLCFLGNVDAGNGDLTVTGNGSIAVNGNVTSGPNSYWSAQSIGVVGVWDTAAHPSVPVTKISAFSDPLASMALPFDTAALPLKANPCGATGGTGRYGALSVANNATCNLLAGLYVISGTWELGNQSILAGTGVTLYVKGPSGFLKFKNGDAIFSAPLTAPMTGVPEGYAIIYDRNNNNALELQGNGTTSIKGAVYAAGSKLDFNGNSCFGFKGGPFVFGSGYTNGNPSCVNVTEAKSITVTAEVLHLNQ